jgi:hypothetical protein
MENMSSEQDQQVTVRLLPDGDAHAALLNGLNGHLLRIDLSPNPGEAGLNAGNLVEVTCPKTLYLGEVRSRQGETIIVGVEHSLDRETLALIQQVWHGPAGQ